MKLIANLSEIDRKTIQQAGLSAETLMERAGEQVASVVMQVAGPKQKGVLVCGPGNNGGDGFVCARKLYEAGYQTFTVIYTGTGYKNEALVNLEKILMGLPVQVINAQKQLEQALVQIRQANFIVDALFGSGLNRPVEGMEARLIEAMNCQQLELACPSIAVDVPSGLNAATGQALGSLVQATETVTFAVGKPGLYLYPGKAAAGRVHVADIGIPASLIDEDESAIRLITPEAAKRWLPERKADAYKYNHGNVLVIAGSQRMPGAAVLAAEAAMSCGAGLVTLATCHTVFGQIGLMPEIMRLALPDAEALGQNSVAAIQAMMTHKKFNAVVLGPGLGREPETRKAILDLLRWFESQDIAVVVDADGLFALGESPMALSKQFILTPHVGECAHLLNSDSQRINADLVLAAQQAAEQFQANVILKSAATLIATRADGAEAGADCWISPTGNPGMATAGCGDVLSGVIGALAGQANAQGQSMATAAALGVYLHGTAGDIAAQKLTPYAMRASDVTRHLPHAFQAMLAKEKALSLCH